MCSYLDGFSSSYKGIHGYLSLVVCILGTVLNLLNIAVLTRKACAVQILIPMILHNRDLNPSPNDPNYRR